MQEKDPRAKRCDDIHNSSLRVRDMSGRTDGWRERSAQRMCEKVLWLFAYIPGEVALGVGG